MKIHLLRPHELISLCGLEGIQLIEFGTRYPDKVTCKRCAWMYVGNEAWFAAGAHAGCEDCEKEK